MYKEKIVVFVFWKNGNSKRFKISLRGYEVFFFIIKIFYFYYIKIEFYNFFNNVYYDI